MSTRRRKRRRMRELVSTDLELMPMLNVFLAIIPLLLLSAAFTPVSVIPASLPADGGAAADEAPPTEPPLDLVIRILPNRWVVQGSGIETSSIERPQAPRDDDASKQARARLAELLAQIGAAHPNQHEVRIASEPGTHYEDIVDAMDASRGAGFSQSALCELAAGGQ